MTATQVGAVSGDFPYYGQAETSPAEGWRRFKDGEGALVEESLMHQFGLRVGDEVRIGELTLTIVGALLKVPGDNELYASLAPRVLIPLARLEATKLLGDASLARYRRYIRFDSETAVEDAVRRGCGLVVTVG